MTNDLCVMNRDDHQTVASWIDLSKVPSCPQFVTNELLPGTYNYWPFIIWAGVGCFVALCLTIMVTTNVRNEARKVIHKQKIDAELPDILKRLGALEHYTGKVLNE